MGSTTDGRDLGENVFTVIQGMYKNDTLKRPSHKGLAEEHFSNILAWLLDPEAGHGFGGRIVEALLDSAEITEGLGTPSWIGREVEFAGERMKRRADILISFAEGTPKMAVEVKTDRAYEDPAQIRDYRRWPELGESGYLVFLCPRKESLLLSETREALRHPRNRHVTWSAFLNTAAADDVLREGTELGRTVVAGLGAHFERLERTDFKWMAEQILEDTEWTEFYPDDFKDEFRKRYENIYQEWVERFGERGNGGAHQRLTAWLSAQSRAKGGLLVRLTDDARAPRNADWGFPIIYKYRVVKDAAQKSGGRGSAQS